MRCRLRSYCSTESRSGLFPPNGAQHPMRTDFNPAQSPTKPRQTKVLVDGLTFAPVLTGAYSFVDSGAGVS